MKRATIGDIRKHEWFSSGCPGYMFPDEMVTDDSAVDTDAVKEVYFLFGINF